MVVIRADKVSRSYGALPVITDVSFRVEAGEKLGLVGRNGAGKTTLLRIIAGLETPDSGELVVAEGVRIGYVAQNPAFEAESSIVDAVYEGFSEVLAMQRAIAELSHEMARPGAADSPERLRRMMAEYAALTERFERADGYAVDSRVAGVLVGLGFARGEWTRPVASLSGGERTRLCLARALLSRPEVLLLDEPTNHLDIPSTVWLEDFLAAYPGAVVVVSHDRRLLDRVASKILEVEEHRVTEFPGNYSAYAAEKERRLAQQETAYRLVEKEVARLEGALRHYTALSARNNKFARRAEDVRKKLARVQRVEKPITRRGSIGFSLEGGTRSGQEVLTVKDLAMRFGDRTLFSGVRFHVRRGEHVGIVGRNGVGKSTLLHILTGRIEPSAGSCALGAGVVIGYYDQQHSDLASDRTVIEEVLGSTGLTPQEARNLLGRFMFRGDDVFKRVCDLSGGERNRVLLARLMASGCNLLVMDEPTNHLDIESVQVLENALASYEGTLLVVSHDRYFLERIADRILELEGGRVTDYPGGYAYYVEKKSASQASVGAASEPVRERAPAGAARSGGQRTPARPGARPGSRGAPPEDGRDRELMLEALERDIVELESNIEQLNAELADLELYRDPGRLAEKARLLAAAQKELAARYRQWEDAAGGGRD